jgi:hypothetical protein
MRLSKRSSPFKAPSSDEDGEYVFLFELRALRLARQVNALPLEPHLQLFLIVFFFF